jgi:SAM-dependent methyltransferase
VTGPACPKIHRAALGRVRRLGLPRGARILDAPCGEGELAGELLRMGFDLVAADVTEAARAVLGDKLRIVDLDGPLPWPDNSFDLVLCVEGIEHLQNPFACLSELRRIVRPKGLLLLTTPNTTSIRSRVRFLGSGFYIGAPSPLDESGHQPPHHIGLRTFPEWRYALHISGFRLIEVGQCNRKWVSFAYAFYAPWIWLYTLLAFRKEKNPAQRERNREIRRQMLSPPLLFGDNLLLLAEKI